MQTTFMASIPDQAGNNRQITQAKLAEYLELKEVVERAEVLRKQILAALQQGVEVERGPLRSLAFPCKNSSIGVGSLHASHSCSVIAIASLSLARTEFAAGN